jgi:hypothetical protein
MTPQLKATSSMDNPRASRIERIVLIMPLEATMEA